MIHTPEIPGYHIEGILGRGSMATVYRAVQTAMNRVVALKILHPDIARDERTVRRLLREAKLAARLNHPHIVRPHDAGIIGDYCFFAMECVEGRNLRDIVATSGPLDEGRAVRYMVQISEALRHMAQERIVHRDIKPANIIINRADEAMLADLGLAKVEFDSTMTSKDRAVGTPQFMSPEQARDPNRVDTRSDIFSLGATFYHLLTGVSPFEAMGVGAVLTKVLYDDPSPVRVLNPELSDDVERVVEKMLRKERGRRYSNPSELLRDLRALQRGALPPNLEPPPVPFWRRKNTLTSVAVLVPLVAVLIWSITRETPAHDDPAKPANNRSVNPEEMDDAALARRVSAAVGATPDPVEQRILIRRLDAFVRIFLQPARETLAKGEFVAAARRAGEDMNLAIRERFGCAVTELPPELRDLVILRREEFLLEVDTAQRNQRNAALNRVRAGFEKLSGDLLSRAETLRDDDITRAFADFDPASWDEFGVSARVDLSAEMERWKEKIRLQRRIKWQEQLESIAATRRARRYNSARRQIAELRLSADRSMAEVFAALDLEEQRVHADEETLFLELSSFLSTIDRIGDQGAHPELAMRRFRPTIEAINAKLSTMPEESSELGRSTDVVLLLRELVHLFTGAERWLADLWRDFEGLSEGTPLSVSTVNGEVFENVKFLRCADGLVYLEFADRPETAVAFSTLSYAFLEQRRPPPDELSLLRIRMLFAYCDGEFVKGLDFESQDPADRVINFLARRAERALAVYSHVHTPAEQAAHKEWLGIIAQSRLRDWSETRTRVRALLARPEWTDTDWFRANRRAILDLSEEVEGRWALAETCRRFHSEVTLVDWRRRVVVLTWDFNRPDEIRDFTVLPKGAAVRDGALTVPNVAVQGRLHPRDVPPLGMDLPFAPDESSLILEAEVRMASDPGQPPRFFVMSAGGLHVGILSRVIRSSHLRTLSLHGLDSLSAHELEIGQVASWSGDVQNFERIFLSKLRKPRVVTLEPGRIYNLRWVIDLARRQMSFALDGVVLVQQNNVEWLPGDQKILIREATGWSLNRLRIEGRMR